MSPASKIPPNRMSAIKINKGIGDSSFDESFLSWILSTFFPAMKTSLNLSFLEVRRILLSFIPFISPFGELFRKICGQPPSLPPKGATSMNRHLLWMILPNLEETVLRKRYPTFLSVSNSEDSLG
jgi:hypothetical protein